MWNSNKIVGNILGKNIGRDTRSRNMEGRITPTELAEIRKFANANGVTITDTYNPDKGNYLNENVIFSNGYVLAKSFNTSKHDISWGSGRASEIINRFHSLSAALKDLNRMMQ